MRRLLVILPLLVLCWALGVAQEAAPQDEGFGIIRGVVKQEDGTPMPNVAVVVTVGKREVKFTADQNGAFQGLVPAGKAVITTKGIRREETIAAGQLNVIELAVLPRQVKQIARDAAGKPLPGEKMFAIYCWNGQAKIDEATANAQGEVLWKGLPEVSVITWGEHAPAGMIAPGTETVVSPLPVQEQSVWASFTLTDLGKSPGRLSWTMRGAGTGEQGGGRDYSAKPEGVTDKIYWYAALRPGMRFSFQATLNTTPPRIAYLHDIPVPFLDQAKTINFTVSMRETCLVRGRFANSQGQPVPGVSRVKVVPVDGMLTTGDDTFGNVVEKADGGFTLSLPFPGKYRMLVDLYDENAPPPPSLLLEVKPGEQELVIRLPEPLMTVPAGTSIYWRSLDTPYITRTLRTSAHAPQMPVFGPRERLLALWYTPSPEKLVLLNGTDTQQPASTLLRRSVFLTPRDKQGNPYNGQLVMKPLLPDRRADHPQVSDGDDAGLELAITLPAPGGNARGRLDCWSGKFALYQYPDQDSLGLLELPEGGKPAVDCLVDTGRDTEAHWRGRKISLIYPPGTPVASNDTARTTTLLFDVAPRADLWNGYVPEKATRMTVQWLGVGVMSEVPIPATQQAADREISITLPAWTPGLTVSGTVILPDGTPAANRELQIGTPLMRNYDFLHITTDADGNFSVSGVLPGPLFVFLADPTDETKAATLRQLLVDAKLERAFPTFTPAEQDGYNAFVNLYRRITQGQTGGWTLMVPEKGLAGVELRMAANPVRLALDTAQPAEGDWGQRFTWWVPDGLPPVALLEMNDEVAYHDLPLGEGWLWSISETGEASCVRMRPLPGWNAQEGLPNGPALGLLFPWHAGSDLPGAVTLTGQGRLAGITVQLPAFSWQPMPLLGLVAGQIDALPPGTYQVQVETTRGILKRTIDVPASGGSVRFEATGDM
ncbi:MAG: carboxypeptidase-like regulatory domain-containing protein [Armatimonadota bacterium]